MDIHDLRQAFASGRQQPRSLLDQNLARAESGDCDHVWVVAPDREAVHAQLAALEQRRGPALAQTPLAGLAVSIKDLFDVAGETTTAGSRLLDSQHLAIAPAQQDAPAVARLRAAGAVLFGRTQMSEFAFSGVGVNPHHGTPRNPRDLAVDRVPGGSSSGGAVSVATGACWATLGSDTGGSLRIPAALCGIVGFKSTARLVPAEGAFPLSTTLDTVGAMTLSVRDAIRLHEVLAARTVVRSTAPLSTCRLAVPQNTLLDSLEPAVARAFQRALEQLSAAGARIETIALPELDELPALMARGTLPAAEAHALHRGWLAEHGDLYDPRVRSRIERGGQMLAADYIELLQHRRAWISRVEQVIAPYDALLSPTVPIVAPPLAQLSPGAARDDDFFRTNALLLRNPSVINFLDGCALSLPCQVRGELPVGLMVWHAGGHDDAVLHVAQQAEAALQVALNTH